MDKQLTKSQFFIIATRNDQRLCILYVCTLHVEKNKNSGLQHSTIQNKIKKEKSNPGTFLTGNQQEQNINEVA